MKGSISSSLVLAVILLSQKEAHATEALLRSCPSYFSGTPSGNYDYMQVDVQAPVAPGQYYLTGPAFHQDGDPESCWNYTWFKANTGNLGPITFSERNVWTGGNIDASGGFCGHSTIEYAVYRSLGPGAPVEWVGGGLLWGKSVSGGCSYSVANFPLGAWGTDLVRVSGSQFYEYFIAVEQWAHNHTGALCGAATSCYYGPQVRIGKS